MPGGGGSGCARGCHGGFEDSGWHSGARVTDPAAVDGAPQLGVLWTERVLGGGNLPTSVQSLRLYRPGALTGELRAVLIAREVRTDQVLYDATLVGADGQVAAVLRGVGHTRLPGEAPA